MRSGLVRGIGLVLGSFFYLIAPDGSAQNIAPKREFRGAWVATVTNIDWPSSSRASSKKQKDELEEILDMHQRNGINAVIFQVRPAGDAFYQSKTEPWSKWLTGTQGKAPAPFYDPLEFVIKACHKRGMELHAWFNPFRISNTGSMQYAENSIAKKHPEWILKYGNMRILDPGIPEARQYLIEVVSEVAANYDVDGIHFDDYFYPYPVDSLTLNDKTSFAQYNAGGLKIDDWRRANINAFIKDLSDTLKIINPRVKFGISPFGIWRNKGYDPLGSDTRGLSAYDNLFADSRKWMQEGWIDYIAPQIYWSRNFKIARYESLVDWWGENSFGKHVYPGHALYKIDNDDDATWKDKGEIPGQIKINRSNPKIDGSVFFSTRTMKKNPLGVSDSLKDNLYKKRCLMPAMDWKDSILPERPRNVKVNEGKKGNLISWKTSHQAPDGEFPAGYVVYRFPDSMEVDISGSPFILAILGPGDLSYLDQEADKNVSYQYYVTALDRLHNESLLPFIIRNVHPDSDLYEVAIADETAQIFRKATLFLPEGRTRLIFRGLSPYLVEKSLRVEANGDNKVIQVFCTKEPSDSVPTLDSMQPVRDSISVLGKKLQAINDSMEVLNLSWHTLVNKQMLGGQSGENAETIEQIEKSVTYFQQKMFAMKTGLRGMEARKEKIVQQIEVLGDKIQASRKKPVPGNSRIEVLLESKEPNDAQIYMSYLAPGARYQINYDMDIDTSCNLATMTYKTKIQQKTGVDWEEIKMTLGGAGNADLRIDFPVSIKNRKDEGYFVAKQAQIPIRYVYHLIPGSENPARVTGQIEDKDWRKAGLRSGLVNVFDNSRYIGSKKMEIDPLKSSVEIPLNESKLLYSYVDQLQKRNWRTLLLGYKSYYYRLEVCNEVPSDIHLQIEQELPGINPKKYKLIIHKARKKYSGDQNRLIWNLEMKKGQSTEVFYGYTLRPIKVLGIFGPSTKKKKKK